MYIWTSTLGSMVLDINNNRLDAKFLTSTGATGDYFTIVKGIPNAPSGLTATAISSTQINLAWTDNSSNETGFRLERSTDGTNFVEITTTAPGATSYPNTGLNPGITYYYRVRASNANGFSNYSNTASATTPGGGSVPAAPSGLTNTAVSSSQINLAWTDNSSNEDGFKIERSSDGTSFSQVGTVGVNVRTFSSTGLQRNRRYWHRVRAYNAVGNSAYSNTVNVRTRK
jgi:titin